MLLVGKPGTGQGRSPAGPATLRTVRRCLPTSAQVAGRSGLALIGLAVVALLAVAAAGPSAVASPVARAPGWPPYYLQLRLPDAVVMGMTWTAILLGSAGVLAGLAAVRRGWRPRVGWLLAVAVVAVAAFVVTLPAGSNDLLYYAAYGRISALGHNPYVLTPAQLRGAGDPVAGAVPAAWLHVPSVYGPLATLTEKAAALLAGPSMARTVFWLKVWDGLAFVGIAIVLDRALRHDPAARVRGHLLWTLNPLMLLAAVAGGHVDVLAAAAGLAGLLAFRTGQQRRPAVSGLAAGVLVGTAAAVKASFALYGLALAWTAWRGLQPRPGRVRLATTMAIAAGAFAVLAPCYLIAGRDAITDLVHKAAGPVALTGLATDASVLLAAALLWGLPRGPARLPAVRVAMALSLAWLVATPQQRPWFDAMIFPLLALMPASKLDMLAVVRAAAAVLGELPGATVAARLEPGWLAAASRLLAQDIRPACMAAVAVTLLWLAITRQLRASGANGPSLVKTANALRWPGYSQPERPVRRPWHPARIRSCAHIPPLQRTTHGPVPRCRLLSRPSCQTAIRRTDRVLERSPP